MLVADEIAAVESGDGAQLLQARLACMSTVTRRVLRAALADVPA
jgi:hypothetical protein